MILAVALAGVTALCGLTVYGSYRWAQANNLRMSLVADNDTSAEATETRRFPVDGPVTLEVEASQGDIFVSGAETGEITVEFVKTAWGEDTAEAQAAAEAIQMTVDQEGSRLKLAYQEPEVSDIVFIGVWKPNRVSFRITVPVQTAVKLKTGAGEVELNGTTGDADLEINFGKAAVTGVNGALTVHGSNTGLTVIDVEAGEGDILLETNFGGITAEDLSANEIMLRTASGEISAENLEAAETLVIENQFSPVSLKNVHAGALKADIQNGTVEITGGEVAGELGVAASFGDLLVQGVTAAEYRLETSNGRLRLEGARGRLDLSNQFGEIEVTGAEEALLNIQSANGKVAFEGSLSQEESHKIETSFGDILLEIPPGSHLDIDLETSFGRIESELPVSLSGTISETSWTGSLNGGGVLLTAATENGNIVITALNSGE
jgi:DUF4097 and DUF4098 domain-containing protein YvlB